MVAATASAAGPQLDAAVEELLAAPMATVRRGVPKGFRIIALSNVAQYCANVAVAQPALAERARACLRQVVETALDPQLSPYPRLPPPGAPLGGHGLYLSHLNIALGAYRRAVADGRHDALHARVSQHLAAASLADPLAHAPSYPGVKPRWPADQAATLYSLHLYDRATGEHLSDEPIARWLELIAERGTAKDLGLPVSDVAHATSTSALPRGCALSFTVRYMATFAPDDAARLWERYRDTFLLNLGVAAGLREWPPGIDRASDVDSGPIVLGVGAAATGLGLAASKAVGDTVTYYQLRGSELVVRGLGGAALEAAGSTLLAKGISLAAETHVAWY